MESGGFSDEAQSVGTRVGRKAIVAKSLIRKSEGAILKSANRNLESANLNSKLTNLNLNTGPRVS